MSIPHILNREDVKTFGKGEHLTQFTRWLSIYVNLASQLKKQGSLRPEQEKILKNHLETARSNVAVMVKHLGSKELKQLLHLLKKRGTELNKSYKKLNPDDKKHLTAMMMYRIDLLTGAEARVVIVPSERGTGSRGTGDRMGKGNKTKVAGVPSSDGRGELGLGKIIELGHRYSQGYAGPEGPKQNGHDKWKVDLAMEFPKEGWNAWYINVKVVIGLEIELERKDGTKVPVGASVNQALEPAFTTEVAGGWKDAFKAEAEFSPFAGVDGFKFSGGVSLTKLIGVDAMDVDIKFNASLNTPVVVEIKLPFKKVTNVKFARETWHLNITPAVKFEITPNYEKIFLKLGESYLKRTLAVQVAGKLASAGQIGAYTTVGAWTAGLAAGGLAVASLAYMLNKIGEANLEGKNEGIQRAFARGYAEIFYHLIQIEDTEDAFFLKVKKYSGDTKVDNRKLIGLDWKQMLEKNKRAAMKDFHETKGTRAMNEVYNAGRAAALISCKHFIRNYGMREWKRVAKLYYGMYFVKDKGRTHTKYNRDGHYKYNSYRVFFDEYLFPQIRKSKRVYGIPPLLLYGVDAKKEEKKK